MIDIRDKILNLAEPLVKAQGLEIWGLDVQAPPRNLVRLFVEVPLEKLLNRESSKPDSPTDEPAILSATIEQCEEISRQLGLALEVEDCFPGPWTLEVSTPGLERKFYKAFQLAPYIGDLVEVRLQEPLPGNTEGRKVYRGKLVTSSDQDFEIEPQQPNADGSFVSENLPNFVIPWDKVRHISRIHQFNAPAKPGKKKSAKRK